MRKETLESIKLHAIGAAIGAAVFASFLLFGCRAKAATIRDGVHSPVYAALQTMDRQELADMRNAEEWVAPEPEWVNPLSQYEMDLLAALLWSEAGDQVPLYEGLCWVCDVVLNRCDSSVWPGDIASVIYQPGQFSVVANGALDRAYGNAPQICYDAIISQLQNRWNYQIQYFSMGYNANGTLAFTHGTHFYSY